MPRLDPEGKKLTHKPLKDFCDALSSAYSTPAALNKMLQDNLDNKRLPNLSLANDMGNVVLEVINKAEDEAWSRELLQAARTSSPENPELLSFEQQFSSSDSPDSANKKIQETQEIQIRRIYRQYQKLVEFSTTPENKNQIEGMISKYREMLVGYLHYYQDARKCAELTIPQDIKRLIKKFPDPARMRRASISTKLQGAKLIRIEISQMFQIIDLLIQPETLKASKLRECFTDRNKLRRLFNKGTGYSVGEIGELKPVLGDPNHNDGFWGRAWPDLRETDVRPLRFIPLQLSLSKYLTDRFQPISISDNANLQTALKSIENPQISGRLRIYPPGTGVVQMALTLTFTKQIHVELVAQIAKRSQDLLFVDQGSQKTCATLFFEVVDQVIQKLGLNREAIAATRCWSPPEITFCIYGDGKFAPHLMVNKLAHLMDCATENEEDMTILAERIEQALRSRHWLNDKILFTVGTNVALLISPQSRTADGQPLLDWLLQTRELGSAAIYARRAFVEKVEKLSKDIRVDDRFDHDNILPDLECILHTMVQVMEAIGEINAHLDKMPPLRRFSEKLWQLTPPTVSDKKLSAALSDLEEQMLREQRDRPDTRLEAVIKEIHKLQKSPSLYYIDICGSANKKESYTIEQFEEQFQKDAGEYDHFRIQTGV